MVEGGRWSYVQRRVKRRVFGWPGLLWDLLISLKSLIFFPRYVTGGDHNIFLGSWGGSCVQLKTLPHLGECRGVHMWLCLVV